MNCNGKEWEPYSNDIEDFIKEYLNADFMKNYLRDRLNNFTVTFKTFQKPNNNAPKTVKGDYDLSIHGNKIVLVDKNEGTVVEAKCHPDDNFDIGFGIQEAFKKMNAKREEIKKAKEEEEKKIRVGDWVEVVNPGRGSYPGRADFFNQYKTREYAPYYRFGVVPEKGSIGKVVYIEEKPNEINNIYVIQENYSPCYGEKEFKQLKYANGIYLVTINGIRKVAKPQ